MLNSRHRRRHARTRVAALDAGNVARAGQAHARALTLLVALAVGGIALLSTGLGSVAIPPGTTLRILLAQIPWLPVRADGSPTFATILLAIRLPRVTLIALTGTGLASAGAAYQGLFRNPLADPYLLGVAAGAGLGAISVAALQAAQPLPVTLPMGAFVGALAAVAIVYGLARTGHSVSTTTLILAGVAVGAFATELMTLILLRSGEATRHVLSFLLGGYGGAGWEAVGVAAPLILAGYGVLYLYARPLNLLLLDEEQARHLGIDVAHARLVIVGAATLTTAAAVAFSGLIGFVGLLVPHAARFCVGPDHRRLLPLTALAGAGFLMLADLLARTIIAPEELPLGAVTAFAGAPFFLLLLRRARGGAYF